MDRGAAVGYSPWGCRDGHDWAITHTHKENLESPPSWTVMHFKERPCLSVLHSLPSTRELLWYGNTCGNGKKKLLWVEIINVVVIMSLSCVWFFCDPMDYRLRGSSARGGLQARILEWVSIYFSRTSWLRDWTCLSYIGRRFLYHWAPREAQKLLTDILKGGNDRD